MDCHYNNRQSSSLNFSDGWRNLLEEENRKFAEARNKDILDKWLDDEWLDDSFDLNRDI